MIETALTDLWFGFGVALEPQNLMWCFVGVLIAAAATWFAVLYCLALGSCLGGLARACARGLPGHGRRAFAALILLPELAHLEWHRVPALPALFGALLSALQSATPLWGA